MEDDNEEMPRLFKKKTYNDESQAESQVLRFHYCSGVKLPGKVHLHHDQYKIIQQG